LIVRRQGCVAKRRHAIVTCHVSAGSVGAGRFRNGGTGFDCSDLDGGWFRSGERVVQPLLPLSLDPIRVGDTPEHVDRHADRLPELVPSEEPEEGM